MDLTQDQLIILKEFRGRVEHLVPESFKSDHELVRWLIARNFDLNKSEDMLLKSLKWRKHWQVDDILNWEWPEVLKEYMAYGLSGYDKEGCPLWLVPYYGQYLRGIFMSCNYKDALRAVIYVLEISRLEMVKQSEKLGRVIHKQSGIFDLEGFSPLHYAPSPVKDFVPDVVKIYEANYPEHLKTVYVINAPKIFTWAFAILKPFMGEATLSKIQIHGYNKDTWKAAIFKDVPYDQVPKHFGGTMTDADGNPKCLTKIVYGREVPKSYYLKKDKKLKKSEDQYKSLSLGSGAKEIIKVDVKHAGSEIKWEFLSEDFDVGFGISLLDPNGEENVLLPVERVNSQVSSDEGYLICPEAATYQIIFDNEYSYFRSKKLKYNLQVIPPQDHQIHL